MMIGMKTLYGCESDNCAGYCKLHNRYMTVKQIRKKNCLQKQCHYLDKIETHDWWRQRAVVKQKRIERKEKFIGGIKHV